MLISHLSKIGDKWESFLSRNGFTQVENIVKSPIIVNPNLYNPVTERQVFNSPEGSEFNEPTSIVVETPVVKKLQCMFSPKKYLEQVIGELKGKLSPVPLNEPNLNNNHEPVVKKVSKGKK
jgi:hypothetical protein